MNLSDSSLWESVFLLLVQRIFSFLFLSSFPTSSFFFQFYIMIFSTILVAATAVGLFVLPASGSLQLPLNSSTEVERPSEANNNTSWFSDLSGLLPLNEMVGNLAIFQVHITNIFSPQQSPIQPLPVGLRGPSLPVRIPNCIRCIGGVCVQC
ncbi:hypothetical protein WG66_003381 [Moniliophthora roreri]|nr:hypothetical protein WG66_003381 [Moniliophthora roreri]